VYSNLAAISTGSALFIMTFLDVPSIWTIASPLHYESASIIHDKRRHSSRLYINYHASIWGMFAVVSSTFRQFFGFSGDKPSFLRASFAADTVILVVQRLCYVCFKRKGFELSQ
jgi:hypothetical protein